MTRHGIVGIMIGVALLLVVGCRPTPSTAQIAQGKELVPAVCTRCHPLRIVHGHKDDVNGWYAITDRMKTHGAEFTAAEQTAIVGYLAASQPK
jgi:hypothetical protein